MSKELKACPFCGCKPNGIKQELDSHMYNVVCGCNSKGSRESFPGKAVYAWNTRRAPWVAVAERLPEDRLQCFVIWKHGGISIVHWHNTDIDMFTYWLPLDWQPVPNEIERSNV